MKKIVLAKLSPDESSFLIEKIRLIDTYKSLQSNHFLSVDKKAEICINAKQLLHELKNYYNYLFEKYNIPFIKDYNCYVTSDTHELYINICS